MPEALFTPLCERVLEDGHAVRFQASGSSMHPAIRDGEWMTVEPARLGAVQSGDVLLYRSARGLTAHRVARVLSEAGRLVGVIVRGDNAGALDEAVDWGQILGRVIRVERGRRQFDPASRRARLASYARRRLAALKQKVYGLAGGSRLPLPARLWQPSAGQGGPR